MSTLIETQTRQVTLPRVNLLPPEIGQQRRFRRTQSYLAGGLLATVGIVAGMYALAAGEVNRAEETLAAEQAKAAELQVEVDTFADVPRTYALVDAKVAQVELAMGQEVRWSQYLNGLSLTLPEAVWVEQVTMSQTVDQAAGAPVASAEGPYSDPGLGQVVFTGKARTHNDVATWLEALATQKGYTQPYFTSSALTEIGDKAAVEYSAQVTVTPEALSGRYTKGAQ